MLNGTFASWLALSVGSCAFLIGLATATMPLNEKGYYLAVLLYGLFGVVSLQKTLRDRAEGIPTTGMYTALCWFAVLSAIVLLAVGLAYATLALSEKGFYGMAFILALFSGITVQKNTRDIAQLGDIPEPTLTAPAPTLAPSLTANKDAFLEVEHNTESNR
jgi:uncharacterized membrane protein YiaA